MRPPPPSLRAAPRGLLLLRAAVAATFVASAGFASDARADDALDPAHAHFDAGVALLQDPEGARYEEAYREFREAFAASGSPRVLGNVGFCAMKLERDGEAIEAYGRYLDEVADVDPVEREQIKRDLQTLKSGVARLELHVPAGAAVHDVRVPVRGEPVKNVYVASGESASLAVRPGHHLVTVRVGERASETWEVEVAPGATLTRRLALRPLALPAQPSEPPRPRGSRVAPALVTLAGLGTLAAGGVTGYFAFQKVDAIAGRCPAGECEAGYDLAAAQRRARVFTTTTDVLLVSGSVLTVGGLVWYLVASSGGTREPGPPPPATAGATCSGQGCVATLGGRF